MSGNADLKLVIDGVNEGRFSQFIEKPWVDDALKISLRKLIEAPVSYTHLTLPTIYSV